MFTEPKLEVSVNKMRKHVTIQCPTNLMKLQNATAELIEEACQPDRTVFGGKVVKIKPPPTFGAPEM